MTYEMLGASPISTLRGPCDFDLPPNTTNNGFNTNNNYNTNNNANNNGVNVVNAFPFKPLALSFSPAPSPIRPHHTIAEQAELEFELRYRGNLIVDQQRKIVQLEEELKRTRDQMDMMNNQLSNYEQEKLKEKKKPQSRYWTPDEHQRFLEALTKYGHKDVKAISMHVNTRNATQVRTHAQKYFLRLERERRKKGEEDGKDRDNDAYNSSGDEMYNSDQSLSPTEDLSPPTSISSPPHPALMASQPLQIVQQQGVPIRRRRSTSLIAPSMGKFAPQHQTAVLAELPTWTVEDYDQFCKGLLSIMDNKQDLDIGQVCRAIRDGFLPSLSVEDVECCYKQLHKILKQKPPLPITPVVGSPKRRRTSKPELPLNMPMISNNDGPLPAMGMPPISNTTGNFAGNFTSFMGGLSLSTSPLPPPPQYMSTNNISNTNSNSSVNLLPFQPPQLMNINLSNLSNLTNLTTATAASANMTTNNNINNTMNNINNNVNHNMNINVTNMRPLLDYSSMPSMQSLQISNMGMGINNLNSINSLGMMDIGTPNHPPSGNPAGNSHWNSALALSFDFHQNQPSSLSLSPGAPLVSSLN